MENERVAAVFVHGFMGSPKQFVSLKERLADCGADIYCPVLAGHETSFEDFQRSNGEAWQKSLSDAVDGLRDKYDRIILIGHSMGGLLAVREAVRNSAKIDRVIAIGFPITVTVRPSWLQMNMKAAKPAVPGEDPRITAARSMAGVKIDSVGKYFRTLPNNMQFLHVAADSRKQLPKLKTPLTVINFKKDEIVGGNAKKFVMKILPNTKFYLLDNSYHFYFTPEETELMVSVIKDAVGTKA